RGYGPARFAAHSVALGARPDRSTFPAQAPCPVLIAGASHDQVVPTEEQRRWAESNSAEANRAGANRAGPNSVAYVEIPETGHMLPVEAPEELAAAISDWWRRTEA
ncbi:MAG: alpha/beta fold hydrolase, partial [Dietzia sp.]